MRSEAQLLAQQDAQRARLMRRLTRRPAPLADSQLSMPFEASKILLMPVFYGVNSSEDAEGFGDVGTSPFNCTSEKTSLQTSIDNQILSELVEIFFGICAQRSLGTPPIFDKPFPGSVAPGGKEVQEQTPGKTEGLLRYLFSPAVQNLHSGMYSPEFAASWKKFFSEAKLKNYYDLLPAQGTKKCKDDISKSFDTFFKHVKTKKSANSGGPGTNVDISLVPQQTAPDNELWKTFQSAWELGEPGKDGQDREAWDIVFAQLREKLSLIIVPIYKKTGRGSQRNSLSAATDIDSQMAVEMARLRNLDLSERQLLGLDGENLPFPVGRDKSPVFVQDVDSCHEPGRAAPSGPIRKTFSPFRNHAEESSPEVLISDAKDDLYNYYFSTEGSTPSPETLRHYDWHTNPCVSSASSSVPEYREEIGFVMIALVSDPNWSPYVAIETLCSNSRIEKAKKFNKRGARNKPSDHGQSGLRGKDESVSHMYSPWFNRAPLSHVANSGLTSKKWNFNAARYSGLPNPASQEGAPLSDDLGLNHPEGTFSQSTSRQGPSSDWGRVGSPTDPSKVYSLENAIRWIEAHEGDAGFLELCTSIDDLFEDLQPDAPKKYNFEKGTYYTIPYDRFFMYAGDDEEPGLEDSFFPWKKESLQEFLSCSVLGISKHSSPHKGKTICINAQFLDAEGKTEAMLGCKPLSDPPEEKRAYLRSLNVDTEKLPIIKENLLRSLQTDPDTLSKNQRFRAFSKTNVSTGGVDFSRLDWLQEKTIQEALSYAMHPQTRLFWTHLRPNDVSRAAAETCSKMGDELPEIARHNAIMITQEILSPLYELVLKEKPKECDIADGVPVKAGICSEWFGVSRSGAKIGDRTIFTRQFSRYCKLRENFEFLACKKLQEAISSKDNLLTAGMKAAISYEKGPFSSCGRKVHMGFERNDFAACAFGNYLEKEALNGRFLFNISHATHHYLLISLGILDYGRFAFDLHFNFFNSGPGSSSKSFVCEIVLKQLFEGSVREVDSMTPKSFHVEACLADLIIYIDEMNKEMQGGKDESEVFATLLKRVTTGQRLVLSEFRWVEDSEGNKRRMQRDLITVVMGTVGGNGNELIMTAAMATRYHIKQVAKYALVLLPKESEGVIDEVAFQNLVGKLMNHLSSGTSPHSIFSKCGNHFLKLCDRSHSDLETANELLNAHGDELFQTAAENLMSNGNGAQHKNYVNGRAADLFLSKVALPVTTVMQSMFQENLQGENDAPFSSGAVKLKAQDAVRTRQLLVLYVFKMIQVKALPDVNLTLAHMVIQKYFAHLKLHGNIEPDTYRTVVRILILCRIVTIIEGLLYVFSVEGCDHPKDAPFDLGALMAIKPYLWCSDKNAIFACTLLAEEYMGPYDSSIIKTLGYSLCYYYDDAKLEECVSSYKNIKQSLERLIGSAVFDADLAVVLEQVALENDQVNLAPETGEVQTSATTRATDLELGDVLRQARSAARLEEQKRQGSAYNNRGTSSAMPGTSITAVSPSVSTVSQTSRQGLPTSASHQKENTSASDDGFFYDPPSGTSNTSPDKGTTANGVEIEEEEDPSDELSEREYLSRHPRTDEGLLDALCDVMIAEEERETEKAHSSPNGARNQVPRPPLPTAVPQRSRGSLEPLEMYVRKLYEKKDLMPHEIFLLDQGTEYGAVTWEWSPVESRGNGSEPFDHPGNVLNPPRGEVDRFPRGQRQGITGFEFASKKKVYNLNYVNIPHNSWTVATEILKCMFNVGPSLKDVKQILKDLCKHKVVVPLSYAKPMLEIDIKALANRSVENLLEDKILVRGRTYPLLKENPKDSNGKGYFSSSISLLVHSLKNCVDPRELIVDAVRSMIHRGMKPCRIPLGIMADPDRAKFAWVDVSEKDVNESKKRCWEVVKGSFMTERESNVVFGRQAPPRRAPAAQEQWEKTAEEPIEDTLDDEVDSSEWFAAYKSQVTRDGGAGETNSNILKIFGDANHWMALRHFLNVGIPHGPHPKKPQELVWYYRPVIKKGTVGRVYGHDCSTLEYRDLPTPYNQHMRALRHLRHETPGKFKDLVGTFDKTDILWFARSAKHYQWLEQINESLSDESRDFPKPGKRKNPLTVSTNNIEQPFNCTNNKGKEGVSQSEEDSIASPVTKRPRFTENNAGSRRHTFDCA